jgi:hypothetical protein
VPRLAIALLTLAVALALAAPAGAQDSGQAVIDRAASALRSAPVYQDPAAETKLSDSELSDLRRLVADQTVPIYIALLPGSAGAANGVVVDLGQAVGRRGTYAVIVRRSFRAASNAQPEGVAGAESRAAFQAHRDEGAAAVLEDFVRRTAQEGVQAPGGSDGGSGGGGESGGGTPWFLVLILGVLAFFGFRAFGRRRRQRAANDAAFADVKRTAEDDIAAIANDITELDDDVEAAGAPPAAKQAYMRALDHYQHADETLRRASTVEEVQAVAETAADGRYEMAVARAHLEGRPVPERRPPCFFDPRHGPSVTEVEYAPPGGEPRPVPVCQADAVRVAQGEEPQPRTEMVGGQMVPYWAAPGYGYYGGAFGGFGPGLLGGFLLGSMFSAPMAWGGGWGEGGEGDWGGGGDSGGGDF